MNPDEPYCGILGRGSVGGATARVGCRMRVCQHVQEVALSCGRYLLWVVVLRGCVGGGCCCCEGAWLQGLPAVHIILRVGACGPPLNLLEPLQIADGDTVRPQQVSVGVPGCQFGRGIVMALGCTHPGGMWGAPGSTCYRHSQTSIRTGWIWVLGGVAARSH